MLHRRILLASLTLGATFPAIAQDQSSTAGSVITTVAQSEWCATGTIFVDTATGRYMLTPAASRRVCDDPALERPVEGGTLTTEQLEAVRVAYLEAVRDGVSVPECSGGATRPARIVVSNGGPRVLVVTTGPYTLVARENLGCWTSAADKLHHVLSTMFTPSRAPSPPRD